MTSISKLSPTVQTLEEKRDALHRCCSGLRFHSCLIFEPEEIESLFNTEVFILCLTKFFQEVFGKNTPKEKSEITFRRVSNILSLCVYIYIHIYINLMNNVAVSFRNFHHQAVFSLNKILAYGGIIQQ